MKVLHITYEFIVLVYDMRLLFMIIQLTEQYNKTMVATSV